MISFKKCVKGELAVIRSFAQKEFNEFNFAQMLPKLYADNAKSEDMHTFLCDDNEAKGMLALQIQNFTIAGNEVKVGWLGSICVQGEARGKGYLSQIMQYSQRLLQDNNCDIAVLGGQRQRYKRFGYEYGGSQWIFTLTNRNLRDVNAENISLQPLDGKWLDKAFDLYCTDEICGARKTESFNTILSSWGSKPYAIVKDNTFTGYCTLRIDKAYGQIYEMRLIDPSITLNACKAVLNICEKDEIIIYQCQWASNEVSNILSAECENARLAENHSYCVLNWQKVILSGLQLRAKHKALMQEGTACIEIKDSGIFNIIVTQEKEVYVEQLTNAESIDISLTQEQAIRLLLGHTSSLCNELAQFPYGWLPLPIGFSWLDGI